MLYLKGLFFALLAPGVVAGAVPWLLGRWGAGRFDAGPARYLGLLPLALGVPLLLWCIYDFARTGRGTLAPVDPPKVFVSRGPYRRVRNPMYVGVLSILAGETLLYGTWLIAAWAVFVGLGFHVFVVFYEEPHLRRRFGPAYEEYLRTVSRWLPHLGK